MRSVSDKNILKEFCTSFCTIVDKHCKYIIVSGFIAIASGRTRGTEDIDMIIEKLSVDRFKKLHEDLTKKGFICMQSENYEIIFDYLEKLSSVRYTYKDKLLPEMEIKFEKDELDRIQLKNRIKLKLTGLNVWFSSVNANIAFKEEYLKSDKDIEDAKHLRIVYSSIVNEREIDEFKKLIRRYRL